MAKKKGGGSYNCGSGVQEKAGHVLAGEGCGGGSSERGGDGGHVGGAG